MSRRHAPSFITLPMTRVVSIALAVLLAFAALLPVAAAAQDDAITPKDIQWEWQLLTQVDADGKMEDVPAGVGATLLLRSGAASGEGACSTYDASYSINADVLNVFVAPDEIEWRDCDPESRAFDEAFYANLDQIASISDAEDVLRVRDVVGELLMVFTRAKVANDPTASRWSLARIGGADGSVEPAIQGLKVWMEFLRGGSLVGSTGCGSFLGKYQTNLGRIDITDVDARLDGCTEGSGTAAQAERVLATLDEITDFQVRPAGLALEDEQGTIRLALTPDLDVAKRTWTPTVIFDENGRQQFGSGNELTTSAVQFISTKFNGHSICRPFIGKALRSGLAIAIGQPEFVGEPEECKGKVPAGTLGSIEEAFIFALEDAASFALRGDELTLIDVNGTTRAVLEPQPPLTGTTWQVFRMRQGKKLVTPSGDVPITATFEDVAGSRVGTVQGKTGVANPADVNEYFGTFESNEATRIEIGQLDVSGRGCDGNRSKSKACREQGLFLKLLASADGYIAREDDLKIRKGRQNLLIFREERLDASDE